MTVTARQLNRATLERQMLLRRERLDVVGAVHRVVALQAQEAASPYIALWNRIDGFDPADLDVAFRERRIVKASLLRVTLHAVDLADYPALREAMQSTLRAARLGDDRFKVAGLTNAQADALVPEVLAFASEPRSNAEVEAWLDERLGVLPRPGIWWALRQTGPYVHHPTGGTWSFGTKPSYVAAPDHDRPEDRDAAVRHLVRRYLEGFGPATIADIAQFSTIYRAPIRRAIEQLDDELVRLEGPDKAGLFDLAGRARPDEDVPAPARLLGMWDSVVLAHAGRTRLIPPQHKSLVIRTNGDVLPTLLVDGLVRGVWRTVDEGVEATAFEPLDEAAWEGLEAEASALRAFLADRDPAVYRRYAHWWAKLPKAEVRVLARG